MSATILIFVTFMWLCLGEPWCVLYFRQNACRFESRCLFFTGGVDNPRILRAVPNGLGLRLTLESGKTVKVRFPGGSLSPATQQAIALDSPRQRSSYRGRGQCGRRRISITGQHPR